MVPMLQWGFVRWNFSLAMLALHPSTQNANSLRLAFRPPDPLGELRLYFLGNALRRLRVVIELHGELRPPLAHRAEIVHVAKHVGERHHGADNRGIAARLLAAHLTPAAGEIADDAADIILRRHHLDLHDRLQQLRSRLERAFAEGGAGGDLERHHARIDVVIGAVGERHLDVEDGETRQHARLHHALDALGDARDIFLWHVAADDLVHELEALALLVRLDRHLDARELPGAASLLLVGVVDIGTLGDRLAERHLRGADIGLHIELAPHAIDNDVEMQLAHALDDGLAGLMVDRNAERGIFLGETMQRDPKLLLVAFGLGLHRALDAAIGA